MRHTKHRWTPNLQPARVLVDGMVRRVRVCTSCIKAGKVQKA
jgi:large subunit ribosomal protein L28